MNEQAGHRDSDTLPNTDKGSDGRDVLQFIIRTPKEVVIDAVVSSVRVPTQSGQVGIRPRGEASVLAVEAGLILIKGEFGTRYAGTAGGMLHAGGNLASLLTPMAVIGEDVESVSRNLDAYFAEPSEELEARRAMGRLETRILQELRQSDASVAAELRKK